MHDLSEETKAFLRQNDDFARGLTDDERETLELYSGHYSGGLFVLLREVDEDGWLFVKAHDSWDGPDDQGRPIVVHLYDMDDEARDEVRFYATGSEALAAFLAVEPADYETRF